MTKLILAAGVFLTLVVGCGVPASTPPPEKDASGVILYCWNADDQPGNVMRQANGPQPHHLGATTAQPIDHQCTANDMKEAGWVETAPGSHLWQPPHRVALLRLQRRCFGRTIHQSRPCGILVHPPVFFPGQF